MQFVVNIPTDSAIAISVAVAAPSAPAAAQQAVCGVNALIILRVIRFQRITAVDTLLGAVAAHIAALAHGHRFPEIQQVARLPGVARLQQRC